MKYVTPFYYANAADIFSGGEINKSMLAIAAAVTAVCLAAVWSRYCRKDLAA